LPNANLGGHSFFSALQDVTSKKAPRQLIDRQLIDRQLINYLFIDQQLIDQQLIDLFRLG
jgi:hypothetical protein